MKFEPGNYSTMNGGSHLVQTLKMGENISVSAASVRVLISWAAGPVDPGLDACALLLSSAGKVRSDNDFVFYNQPDHPTEPVRHLGRRGPVDAVEVQLARLGPDIDRAAVCASADGRPFEQIRGLHLRVIDATTPTDLARFDIMAGPETALLAGELYRRQGRWKFRAVGQGWASGLAGLATDFGIAIDKGDSAANAGAVVAQSGRASALRPDIATPPPRVSAGEDLLPLDMRKRLFTRKHQVVEILAKYGMACATARVVLVLDCSGSMINLYQKKVIHRAVERVAAVAAQLDDNAQMQAWVFGENPARLPDLVIAELPQWISLHVRAGEVPSSALSRSNPAKSTCPPSV
ncbi:TerD family protein [Nocardia fluminea]|uniref:TerD family protein n=1 Tax=Nocardia fluminea TaxID=134984 RepID=UPI003657030F